MESAFADFIESLCAELERASTMRKDNAAYALATMLATASELSTGNRATFTATALVARDLDSAWDELFPEAQTPEAKRDMYDRALTLTALMLGLAGRIPGADADSAATARELARGIMAKFGVPPPSP